MAFSKSIKKGQIPVGCQLCEGGNKIEWKCTDCNLLMCSRCKDGVHLRIAKDHRILNIKEIGEHEDSLDSFVFSDLKCQDHPDQSCSLYCKTCSKVICLKCIIKVHNGHTFIDEEELNDRKEKLKEGQNNVQRNLWKLSSQKDKRNTLEVYENPKTKHIKQGILDQKTKLHKAVDQYADRLAEDVDQHFGTSEHEENFKIDKVIQNMQMKSKALESIITSRDFTTFFRDFDQLNVSLNEEMPKETTTILSMPNFVPGEFTMLNFGKLEHSKGLRDDHSKVAFKVTNQWTTELENVHIIGRCPDGTLWMTDNINKVFLHIALEDDNVKVLSRMSSIKIFGLLIDISGNIIVSTLKTNLKVINESTKKLTNSVFDTTPFITTHIHITKDQNVLISARSSSGRRSLLIEMDGAGKVLTVYENDSTSSPLFTQPYRVTSTSNGNIFVVDSLDKQFRGRVVVIGKTGNIERIYSGHHDVNTKGNPFTPIDILATPSDNILVVDWMIHVVHILNSDGEFISYFCVNDIGIQYPHSLALSSSERIYIGCGKFWGDPKNFRAKLYEIECYGI